MKKQKLFIIKIGGNVINDEQKLGKFLESFSLIEGKKMLVHGGGKVLNELAEKTGITQEMVNGRRVTDGETLKLATMVYAGLINKNIVAQLQFMQINAIGLSGADGNCITTVKRKNLETDFGFVGDINEESVNTGFLSILLKENIVPVICSITHNGNGQLLNTNADTISAALAISFGNEFDVHLNYCFEKKGVLKNQDDESTLLDSISIAEYEQLLQDGIVSDGMIPKLENAFDAIRNGVNAVVIGHADELINTINKRKNAGTYLGK
ncbi:acetylglutamate kinase [soil metagenome]